MISAGYDPSIHLPAWHRQNQFRDMILATTTHPIAYAVGIALVPLVHVLTEGINLHGYLEDAARDMVADGERVATLKADMQAAEAGLKRITDAVAVGTLDVDAARQKTLELREKRERAQKRRSTPAMSSGWS